jgi:transcriptional regulator with XRE-family HTH domain
MADLDQEWQQKGATLSDKTARQEFGLTQDEIVEAIGVGKLHYRLNSTHGNPWLRLLRREVEDLVKTRYSDQHLKQAQARAELARVNTELKRLRAQLSALEERRAKLIADLGG